MLTNADIFLNRLRDPEYFYLLLEPLPLFGLFFGIIFFAIGLWGKQDKTRAAALILIAAAAASIIPYTKYRQRAMPRVQAVRELSYVRGIKAQTELRRETGWIYYAVGIAALVTLVAGGKIGSLGNYATLVLALLAFLFSLWLHMKEAEVYHPNIVKRAR